MENFNSHKIKRFLEDSSDEACELQIVTESPEAQLVEQVTELQLHEEVTELQLDDEVMNPQLLEQVSETQLEEVTEPQLHKQVTLRKRKMPKLERYESNLVSEPQLHEEVTSPNRKMPKLERYDSNIVEEVSEPQPNEETPESQPFEETSEPRTVRPKDELTGFVTPNCANPMPKTMFDEVRRLKLKRRRLFAGSVREEDRVQETFENLGAIPKHSRKYTRRVIPTSPTVSGSPEKAPGYFSHQSESPVVSPRHYETPGSAKIDNDFEFDEDVKAWYAYFIKAMPYLSANYPVNDVLLNFCQYQNAAIQMNGQDMPLDLQVAQNFSSRDQPSNGQNREKSPSAEPEIPLALQITPRISSTEENSGNSAIYQDSLASYWYDQSYNPYFAQNSFFGAQEENLSAVHLPQNLFYGARPEETLSAISAPYFTQNSYYGARPEENLSAVLSRNLPQNGVNYAQNSYFGVNLPQNSENYEQNSYFGVIGWPGSARACSEEHFPAAAVASPRNLPQNEANADRPSPFAMSQLLKRSENKEKSPQSAENIPEVIIPKWQNHVNLPGLLPQNDGHADKPSPFSMEQLLKRSKNGGKSPQLAENIPEVIIPRWQNPVNLPGLIPQNEGNVDQPSPFSMEQLLNWDDQKSAEIENARWNYPVIPQGLPPQNGANVIKSPQFSVAKMLNRSKNEDNASQEGPQLQASTKSPEIVVD